MTLPRSPHITVGRHRSCLVAEVEPTRVVILMESYTSASVLVRFLSALLLVLWPLGLNAADVDTPPLGVLVDVDGHKVHLYCTGTEGPTVVFLSGASSFSIDWALVQPKLSSRACAFDRPGYAWSDAAGVVDDGDQVVRVLHEVLLRTNQPRPYVLVGHSLGGLFARLFYDTFPEDVGGMVLIDAAHEDGLFTSVDGRPVPITSLSEAEYLAANVPTLPPRVPEARLEDAYRTLPEDIQQLHLALLTRFFDNMKSATVSEMIAFQKASYATLIRLHQISALQEHPLHDVPLIVLSRGLNNSALQQRLQAELARLSTNVVHVTVKNADHEIHLYAPDVTISWIETVLDAVRNQQPLGAGVAQ
jgi:pimeloyl-ACP methyl ester carboxylesterase